MQTGWKYIDGHWYFLQYDSGAMQTGWIYDSADGKWYYSNEKGEMRTGWIPLEYGNYNGGKPYWNFFAYSTGEFLTDSDVQGDDYGKNTFGNHKFKKAPNIRYGIHSSAKSLATLIDSAVSRWDRGTCVSFTKGTEKLDISFLRRRFDDEDVWGEALFFVTLFHGEVDPEDEDWQYVIIQLSPIKNIGLGTISHEMGHMLGLSHRITKYDSIMRQGSPPRTVDTPQQVDFDVVNHLYGN